MADIQEKNPEVEIDTSGVNEETIEVDAPKVSDEAFEKKTRRRFRLCRCKWWW